MGLLKKVMFVDDDRMVNLVHKQLAEKTGLADELLIYNSSEEAIFHLMKITNAGEFPELILVDINMPQIDGHEFAKRVKTLKGFDAERTMLAFLTSSRELEDVVKADEEEVEYFYWKPLDKDTLKKVLKDGFEMEVEFD